MPAVSAPVIGQGHRTPALGLAFDNLHDAGAGLDRAAGRDFTGRPTGAFVSVAEPGAEAAEACQLGAFGITYRNPATGPGGEPADVARQLSGGSLPFELRNVTEQLWGLRCVSLVLRDLAHLALRQPIQHLGHEPRPVLSQTVVQLASGFQFTDWHFGLAKNGAGVP